MAESNSKRQKAAEEEDRISSLPDCMLRHILSFLPTKTSVETSVLARRWRYIWKDLSVHDFSDDSFEFNGNSIEIVEQIFEHFQTFALFVNSVFSLRKPYPSQKMRLSCTKFLVYNKFCRYSVETWVRSVMGPHLKELDLIFVDNVDIFFYFGMPFSLSTCTNLVSLSLHGYIYIEPHFVKVTRLPSLKKLKLRDMSMPCMNAFLVGCPILETLNTFHFYEDYADFHLADFCVPHTLKSLKINVHTHDDDRFLDLNATCFHYLNITQIRFNDVGNLQKVVRASLDVFHSSSDDTSLAITSLLKLLNALSGIKHLALSCSTIKWLLGGPADLHFPKFCHLLHLELILPWFNMNFLLSLLQTCHLLQVLIIQNDKEESPLLGWATQPSVPNCIVSHLTFIQFKGFRGLPDELLFAEYILQKGLVLKTMIIDDSSVDLSKKYNILNKLSKVLRNGIFRLIFD